MLSQCPLRQVGIGYINSDNAYMLPSMTLKPNHYWIYKFKDA
jgi:hypothetical protein